MIIAGYGRVGQLVGEMLDRHKVPYLAIDLDPARVAAERKAGKPVYYGDGSYPEFLRACGIDRALALVITFDTLSSIEAVVSAARQECSDITIVARARDARHATQLYELGVDDAVPETIEASLQLSEAVLGDIGSPDGARDRVDPRAPRRVPGNPPEKESEAQSGSGRSSRRAGAVGKSSPSAVAEQATQVDT